MSRHLRTRMSARAARLSAPLLAALTATVILSLAAAPASAGTNTWTQTLDVSSTIENLAISPNYAVDGVLFGSGYSAGLWKKKADGGWMLITLANGLAGQLPSSRMRGVWLSPAFATDRTVWTISYEGFFPNRRPYPYVSRTGGDMIAIWEKKNTADSWSMAVSPNYAADGVVFSGGVFREGILRSPDRGDNWYIPILDSGQWPDFMDSMALSPAFATDGQGWAAGEDLAGSSTPQRSYLYGTTDSGVHWQPIGTGAPTDAADLNLSVSPAYATDRIVALACSKGLYASTDGGSNWALIGGGLPAGDMNAVAFSPLFGTDGIVFAGGPGGVYRSTDGGNNWAAMNSGGVTETLSLAVSPAFGTDRTLFAGTKTGIWTYTMSAAGTPGGPSGAVRTTVTLAARPARPARGRKVVLSGRVRPGGGRTAALQRLAGRTWKAIARKRVTSTGAYSFTQTSRTASTRRYRVSVPASAVARSGLSPAVTVRWR